MSNTTNHPKICVLGFPEDMEKENELACLFSEERMEHPVDLIRNWVFNYMNQTEILEITRNDVYYTLQSKFKQLKNAMKDYKS